MWHGQTGHRLPYYDATHILTTNQTIGTYYFIISLNLIQFIINNTMAVVNVFGQAYWISKKGVFTAYKLWCKICDILRWYTRYFSLFFNKRQFGWGIHPIAIFEIYGPIAEFILDRKSFLSRCRVSVFWVTVHSLQFNAHYLKKRTCDNAIKMRLSMNSTFGFSD